MTVAANVVTPNFGTPPMAKRDEETEPHPDRALIVECVTIGSQIAAAAAAYQIDPTDSEIASPFDQRASRKAMNAMVNAAALPATTFDGLRAKAVAVKVMLEDRNRDLEQENENLIISLINDVVRLQRAAAGEKRADVVIANFPGRP